ncbi:MAG: hypothetical protein Q9P14_12860 [candidate division KSB1 bacterium]|nr:hypothetical protein [candidate division KSB1 bacterium]
MVIRELTFQGQVQEDAKSPGMDATAAASRLPARVRGWSAELTGYPGGGAP